MSGKRLWTRAANNQAGEWQVVVSLDSGRTVDVTKIRGVPTKVSGVAFSDPYGPRELTLEFPSATLFDRLGHGDFLAVDEELDVDVLWLGELPQDYPWQRWRWSGWMESFERPVGEPGLTVMCKGALLEYDLDNAFPEYPYRPMTYESAIARRFSMRPSSRCKPMRVFFPKWWDKTYKAKPSTPAYMVPSGVSDGDKWSGMLTRETGSWNPVLTGYVAGLLGAMYTHRGRFTIDLDYVDPDTGTQLAPRTPALFHRDIPAVPPPYTIVVDPVDPGVGGSLREDWSQTGNEYHGQGTSLSGVAYSGMEVDTNGRVTGYRPLAAARQVWPVTNNGWFQRRRMRRQVNLQLQSGLSALEAWGVAEFQRKQFTTPGYTGQITLATDPVMLNGGRMLRHLIRPGIPVLIPGIDGNPHGVLFHVTDASIDFDAGSVSLTIDSKWRDRITVAEVRQRGRDALSVVRALIGGKFQPPVPDQLYPWDYGAGSGYIPSGPELSSVRLFKDMPGSIDFPWTEWTTKRPPKAAAWKDCYIRIGPKQANANLNWSGRGPHQYAWPVRMAQAGTVMLVQVVAYDRDGNVMRVPYSVSLWQSTGANPFSTPSLPAGGYAGYPSGQHYPFYPNAWDQFKADGTRWKSPDQTAESTAGLVQVWGAGTERAGFFPGDDALHTPATGLLVDESSWTFDTTTFQNTFDPTSPQGNLSNPMSGHLYVMIYCDAQLNREVFFAGRIYRQPPGSAST